MNKKQIFRKAKQMQSTVQSVLEHERGQLHIVKAWKFPAGIHSKTNLPSSRGSSRCL